MSPPQLKIQEGTRLGSLCPVKTSVFSTLTRTSHRSSSSLSVQSAALFPAPTTYHHLLTTSIFITLLTGCRPHIKIDTWGLWLPESEPKLWSSLCVCECVQSGPLVISNLKNLIGWQPDCNLNSTTNILFQAGLWCPLSTVFQAQAETQLKAAELHKSNMSYDKLHSNSHESAHWCVRCVSATSMYNER